MLVYLAGGSYGKELFYKGISKYVLMSFMERKSVDFKKIKSSTTLLDSGAFTFMNSKKNAKINWDNYIEDYATYIIQNKVDYFFELDIDSIVGLKEVDRLRNLLEKKVGKPSIPVWHKSRGLDYWKSICKRYNYVAIGGIVTKEIKQREYDCFIPLLNIAKKNNCKVHGLGMTRTTKLHLYKFYSVDSTNWITTRFNHYYLYNGRKHIMQSQPKVSNNNKVVVANHRRNDYNKFQMLEWVKFQKYAEKNL